MGIELSNQLLTSEMTFRTAIVIDPTKEFIEDTQIWTWAIDVQRSGAPI